MATPQTKILKPYWDVEEVGLSHLPKEKNQTNAETAGRGGRSCRRRQSHFSHLDPIHPNLVLTNSSLQYRNSGRDAILICIDGSKSMQASRTDEDGQPAASYFHEALECATNLVKRKALVSPYDMFGILLYNTVSRPSGRLPSGRVTDAMATLGQMTGDAEAGDSGVRILLPLGPITLEAIKDLKEHVNCQPCLQICS